MKSYVKPNCVVCGQRLTNPEENYVVRGNFCGPCTAESEHKVKAKASLNTKRLAKIRAKIY